MSEELLIAKINKLDEEYNQLMNDAALNRSEKERYSNALSVFRELSDSVALERSFAHLPPAKPTIKEAIYGVLKDKPLGLNKTGIFTDIQNKYGMTVNTATLSVTLQRTENVSFKNDRWYYHAPQNETAAPPTKQDAADSNTVTTNHGGQ